MISPIGTSSNYFKLAPLEENIPLRIQLKMKRTSAWCCQGAFTESGRVQTRRNKTLCIRWHFHLVVLPEQPWGEKLGRGGGGKPVPVCTLFPMDFIVFQWSLKALTYFFLQETFSHLGPTSYVISFSRGIFLSLLSDMWALSFQKGSLLELGEVQPFQVYLRSMEKRGEGLSPLRQQPCYCPMPPFHIPIHQVQCMDLWTAATNWVCKKFWGVEFSVQM